MTYITTQDATNGRGHILNANDFNNNFHAITTGLSDGLNRINMQGVDVTGEDDMIRLNPSGVGLRMGVDTNLPTYVRFRPTADASGIGFTGNNDNVALFIDKNGVDTTANKLTATTLNCTSTLTALRVDSSVLGNTGITGDVRIFRNYPSGAYLRLSVGAGQEYLNYYNGSGNIFQIGNSTLSAGTLDAEFSTVNATVQYAQDSTTYNGIKSDHIYTTNGIVAGTTLTATDVTATTVTATNVVANYNVDASNCIVQRTGTAGYDKREKIFHIPTLSSTGGADATICRIDGMGYAPTYIEVEAVSRNTGGTPPYEIGATRRGTAIFNETNFMRKTDGAYVDLANYGGNQHVITFTDWYADSTLNGHGNVVVKVSHALATTACTISVKILGGGDFVAY